jgi:hypothetical protein
MASGYSTMDLIKMLLEFTKDKPTAYYWNDLMCANELAIDEKELAKLPDGGELIRQLRNVIRQRDCQIQELRVQINELESDVAEKAKLLWKQKEEYEKKLEAAYTSIGELKDQINFMSSRRGVRLR